MGGGGYFHLSVYNRLMWTQHKRGLTRPSREIWVCILFQSPDTDRGGSHTRTHTHTERLARGTAARKVGAGGYGMATELHRTPSV